MINSIQDHNLYLKKIVNNLSNGVILFIIKGNTIQIIDFNEEVKRIFRVEDIFDVQGIFSKLILFSEIKLLLNFNDNDTLSKEILLIDDKYVALKMNKLSLQNGDYFICSMQDITAKEIEKNLIIENEKKYKNLFLRNQTGIFSLNFEGQIIDCNPAFLEIFKMSTYDDIVIFKEENDWLILRENIFKNQKIINYKKEYINEFDHVFFLDFHFYLDFDNKKIEGNVLDITEVTISSKSIQEKENLYRSIYEESNDSILLLDNDRIIEINQRGLQLFNVNSESVLEKSLWDFTFIQTPALKQQYDLIFNDLKINKNAKFNWIFAKNHTFIETSLSIVPLYIEGNLFYQCVIRDETNRNLAISTLEESKRTFESILENTPEGFIILKNARCLYANTEFFSIFSLDKCDPEILKFDENFFGLNYPKFKALLTEHNADKQIKHKQLKFFIHSKVVEIDLTIVSIIFNNETVSLLIFKNVSYQIKLSKEVLRAELAEESNKRLEKEIDDKLQAERKLESEYLRTNAIFDSSENTLLITITPDLKISSFNKQSKLYFDFQTNKELTVNEDFDKFFEQIISPIKLRYFRYLVSGLRKGKSYQLELKITNIYNEKKWIEFYLNPIKDVSGNIYEFSMVAHDITEKKVTEKKVLQSLKEKEVLLKEVHHRVKNNLQIISSILNLQSSYIEDKKILEILEESRHRIRSMAIIHENLYQTTNFSSINFKDYSRELVRNLISSYQYSSTLEVKVNEKVELVDLSLDQAIPCGLILNELVTNTMKYAFINKTKGIIYLELKEKNNKILLTIGDNGVGLPNNYDIKKSDTLGLQLVMTLVEQLDGEIKIDNNKGIKYFITFEKQKL